jgi:hypothetical protein
MVVVMVMMGAARVVLIVRVLWRGCSVPVSEIFSDKLL